jgi:dipeptidyl aminopeptidase/acylaminoacyl peptidase
MKAALLATAALLLAGAAPARTLTPHDLVTLDRVSDPHLSPDGATVVYDLRSTDYDANKARHSLWLVCATCANPQPTRLETGEGGATNPRWAPDGKSLYFLSSRGGSSQIYRIAVGETGAASTPSQVTHLPLDVGTFRVAPDGKTLVVSLAVFPDCPTVQCTKDRQDEKARSKATGTLYTKLFVRHWDAWADGTRNQLFALALDQNGAATGEARPLMANFDGDVPSKPFGDETDYAISPDARTVIFSARLAGRTEPWSTNFDLFEVSLDGGKAPQDITANNPAWDAAPVFAPDGQTLAYKAMKRPGFEADKFSIVLRNIKTGETHALSVKDWDRSVDALRWSADGSKLYVTADDTGYKKLFAIDPATGIVTALTETGHVGDIDIAGPIVIYGQDSLTSPAQIYRLASPPVQLTHADTQKLAGVDFAKPTQFTFQGWNNETVHGFAMPPAGAKPGEKYPVAFLIHGGPQGSFGDDWSYRWNPQTYAAAGYATVFIDFHGSTGYGQDFTDSISSHWGDRPLVDLQKGWQAALQKFPYLDGSRACALGASYGGFMIYWIEGVWGSPWKCLVDHDGVFDNRLMGYATEELWFSEWENGHSTVWEHPENYERFNPLDQVADWKTPMLVIHSGKDYRIPLEQGLAAFTALQRKGVPSEFLTFPDENHWVLKPQNSELWQNTVLSWLAQWTKPK